jgi:hypothetical protein
MDKDRQNCLLCRGLLDALQVFYQKHKQLFLSLIWQGQQQSHLCQVLGGCEVGQAAAQTGKTLQGFCLDNALQTLGGIGLS